MSDSPIFVDTNILIYLRDSRDREKQEAAAEWLTYLWASHLGRLSVQVLHEYFVTVTGKLTPGLSLEEAREDVSALRSWSPLPITLSLTEKAWAVQDRWGYSFWDSLIVAAAQAQGCALLITEDLSHGQVLDGMRIASPFLEAPSS